MKFHRVVLVMVFCACTSSQQTLQRNVASLEKNDELSSEEFKPLPEPIEKAPFVYGNQAYLHFERALSKKYGVGEEASDTNIERLKAAIQDKLEHGDQAFSAFYKYAIDKLESAKFKDAIERKDEFLLAKRIFYSAFAEEPEVLVDRWSVFAYEIKSISQMVQRTSGTLSRVFFSFFNNSIPYAPSKKVDAEKEADNLVDVDGKKVSEKFLQGRSPKEVADLDVSSAHPIWMAKSSGESRLHKIEEWMERGARDSLKSKYGLDADYKLEKARKVLFYDVFKLSSSSPKIESTDAYGMHWRVKWGEETATAPLGNRLYLRLGGKFTLPAYAHKKGSEHMVLVLNDPASSKRKKVCDEPLNKEEFIDCFKKSYFQFNAEPFIDESGILTEQNVDAILKNLPNDALEKYRSKNLIGRAYLTFKDVSSVFYPSEPYMIRGGPVAFSALGAKTDRVIRGLLVFNHWIGNMDAKDDNNRAYILKGLDAEVPLYYEGQHDFGASFGGYFIQGKVNAFSYGKDFMGKYGVGKESTLVFRDRMGFFPHAWKKTTYADGLWMAEKIAALSRSEIEEDVDSTEWPDFVKQALTYRLIERRNRIAHFFGLPQMKNKAPSLEISLTNDEEIKEAAERYNLSEDLIKAELDKAGLRNKNHVDSLLSDGEITACEKTILIGLLERERYPSGLVYRYGRFTDSFEGERGCHYGDKAPIPDYISVVEEVLKQRVQGLINKN